MIGLKIAYLVKFLRDHVPHPFHLRSKFDEKRESYGESRPSIAEIMLLVFTRDVDREISAALEVFCW